MPVMGKLASGNQLEALVVHGPIATTTTSHSRVLDLLPFLLFTCTPFTTVCASSSKEIPIHSVLNKLFKPFFAAYSCNLLESSAGVTCAVFSSKTEFCWISPSNHSTNGSAKPLSPACTDKVRIFRKDVTSNSSANWSWRWKLFVSSSLVLSSPQPPAKKPPALPEAAGATLSHRSTTVTFVHPLLQHKKYAEAKPCKPPPRMTTFLSFVSSSDDVARTPAFVFFLLPLAVLLCSINFFSARLLILVVPER